MENVAKFYQSLTLPEKIWLRERINEDDFIDHPDQYLIPNWIKVNADDMYPRLKKALYRLYEEKRVQYVTELTREHFMSLENVGIKTWGLFICIQSHYEAEKKRLYNRNSHIQNI